MESISNNSSTSEQHQLPPKPPVNGPEGVDKAPGEETAPSTSDLTRVSQKGKKVDGDPSLPPDQPADENG